MRHKTAIAGAYELKSSYQKNLAIGFGVSGMMHVTILVALVLFVFQAKDITIPTDISKFPDTLFIAPPPITKPEIPDWVKTSEDKTIKTIGIPTPVPDDKAPTDVEIPDQNQLATLAIDLPIGDLGKGLVIDIDKVLNNIENLIPSPDTPTFYDEPPVTVSQIMPTYPPLAERAGIEGYVWIKAYIDKEGNVLQVIVMKSSPSDVGFEEAAIDAAKQTVWRPAISNGMPVGVWITYKVEFKLK